MKPCYSGGGGQKPILNQPQLTRKMHYVLSPNCGRDWSFQRSDLCPLSLCDCPLCLPLCWLHSPKQADFGVRDCVSWSLWAYRLASVINPRETRFRSLSFDLQESKEVGHVPFPGAIKRSLAGGRGNIIGPAKVRGG